MILLEKYNITNGKNELLEGWTIIFDDVENFLSFIIKNKNHLIGNELDKYKIVIRNIGEPYKEGGDK